MQCPRCKATLPDESKYCNLCGKKLVREPGKRKRANGEGSIYTLPNGKIRAVKTLGYYLDEDGKKHRSTKSRSDLAKKKDATDFLDQLKSKKKVKKSIKLKELYDKWKPTHDKTKSTMNCYNAGMNYLESLWYTLFEDIDIDDWQECIDDCPKGKRTKENMRALIGLLYKFAIPRYNVPDNLNLASYLKVSGEGTERKISFSDQHIELFKNNIGKVPYASYIYSEIYLGFRPSEFLSLDAINYNRNEKAFVGGAKTEKGKNRTVTVSPKIQLIIDNLVENKISGPVFCDENGNQIGIKDYRENYFYPVLDALGIANPIIKIGDHEVHTYTPHTCRHTFATLMKHIEAPDKDKLELIGHTSEEMLRYYQDVNFNDLRKITDVI